MHMMTARPHPSTHPAPRRQAGVDRRQVLAALVAAGVLAACGEDSAAVEEAAGTATRTIDNAFGTFEVPTDPQRVVGWEGRRDLETALALGLSPIAIGSNALDDGELAPFVDFDVEGVAVITQTEPDLEQIAALRPDLILTRGSNIEAFLDELRPLAPLVPVGADGPWRPDLEQVAEALGRTDALAETLAAYDERREEIRARHADAIANAQVAIVQFAVGEGFYASPTDGFYLQANTLADLGGTQIAFIEEGGSTLYDDGFSLERTDELAAADVIVLIANTEDDLAELEASPLWQALPAVQAGRVVVTDYRTNYGSVYAATACLELLDQAYAALDA